ncbi:MAG: DUF933 domain-containing protein [Planctomycetota bacterium]|nr:DUF933 domain-containing protein [Planctomycetota bacterium]
MIVGIVGLPGSGKTTVFNAVTSENAPTGTYSAAGTTNTATVWVPDERLQALREHYNPKKYTPASFQFRDFCVVTGEGGEVNELNARMIAAVREVDALVKVVRGFDEIDGSEPQALEDIDTIDAEFLFADLEIIEKRLEKLEKSTQRPHQKLNEELREKALLERCREQLLAEEPLSGLEITPDEEKVIRGFQFITQKPSLVLLNLDDDTELDDAQKKFGELFEKYPNTIALRGSIEMEIAQLPPEEREEFMQEMGIEVSATDRVVQACFGLLGLISFFTIGEDEVKAWTLRKGRPVIDAAGAIHTDLAKGFIRAEVVPFGKISSVGHDFKEARRQGLTTLEHKEYVVSDGDIIDIRFSK